MPAAPIPGREHLTDLRGGLSPITAELLLRDDFLFGVGTAAYQVEGAANVDGRSDSIWDVFCRQPGAVRNGDNGAVACDHYHRWEQDLELLCELGVDAYRFSISWSRILPSADCAPNAKGLAFYRRLVDGLRASGIRPLVTLHHWDLPQYLQDEGGWQSRRTAVRFAEFAAIVADELGSAVDFYTTINEPWCIAFLGHGSGIHAPGIQNAEAAFSAAHHLLLAHGMCVQTLREHAPHADVGIVLNGGPCHAASGRANDVAAARRVEGEQIDLFAGALFEARYPESVARDIERWVKPGDLDLIAEPCDYLGWNYYTRNLVRATPDGGYWLTHSGEYPLTDMGWEIYPQGLYELMHALNERYELPPLYVTENGAAFDDRVVDGVVTDAGRAAYLCEHMKVIDRLLKEGFDIRGYVCWSFMDNFEWAKGYSKRFGLVHVDYRTQTRTVKESGRALASLLSPKRRRRLEKAKVLT